jgi:Tfp pilus assembly protein PilO
MAASDWSERTRMLVTIGVSLLVNGAVGYFLYSAHAKHAAIVVEIGKKQREQADLKQKCLEDGDVTRTLEKKTAEFAALKNRLPEVDPVEGLLSDIGNVEAEAGARLKTRQKIPSTEEVAPGTNYQKGVLRTTWDADLGSFCKVLNRMEDNIGFERFVSFENLTITPKNQGMVPDTTSHSINVDIITYKYVSAGP